MLTALCALGVAHHTSHVSLTHASTVLLNLRRSDFGPAANHAVDIAFAASFFALRFVLLPYWWLRLLAHGYATPAHEWGPCMHGGAVVLVALVGGLFMLRLNLYWASLILRRIVNARSAGGLRRSGMGSNGLNPGDDVSLGEDEPFGVSRLSGAPRPFRRSPRLAAAAGGTGG